MRVIDTHVHVYPEEVIANADEIAKHEPYFKQLIQSRVHRWATVQDVVHAMDEDAISESWICGFGFNDMHLCRLCNDYVLKSAQTYPGRLRPLAVVPPLDPATEGELIRCAELGAVGVGEIFPDGQQWDITDFRQTWKIGALCHEINLFLLIHTAEPVGHDYAGKGKVGPKEIVEFCTHHPESKVIFAHWGGGVWLYEHMPEIKRILKNARYDTAATPFLYDSAIYKTAFAAGVADKLFYGSDFPLLRIKRYKTEALLLEEKGFIEKLFGLNAKKFLDSLNEEQH